MELGDLELDVADELAAEEARLRNLLGRVRSVAVIGADNNPYRPARGVVEFLKDQGIDVSPVAADDAVGGVPAVPTLADASPVDLAVVFCAPDEAARLATEVMPHVTMGVWFQDGVRSEEAVKVISAGGREAVMDRCVMRDYRHLVLGEARRSWFPV